MRKGRDKAEWIGIGRSLGELGDISISRGHVGRPKSAWALMNAVRTADTLLRRA